MLFHELSFGNSFIIIQYFVKKLQLKNVILNHEINEI